MSNEAINNPPLRVYARAPLESADYYREHFTWWHFYNSLYLKPWGDTTGIIARYFDLELWTNAAGKTHPANDARAVEIIQQAKAEVKR